MPTPIRLETADRKRLRILAGRVQASFNDADWRALATMTGTEEIIVRHDRLLRSLRFGDPDYEVLVYPTILQVAGADADNEGVIRDYLDEQHPTGENISATPDADRKITFTPNVFVVPTEPLEDDLVAVMIPFTPQFEPVFQAIKNASDALSMRCLRAKDIWRSEAVIQDIFSLIFRAKIVICDFTGKNANVFYEAGIAHTLGKHVIPITQVASDVPFDVQHHRYFHYLGNQQGMSTLSEGVYDRLYFLKFGREPNASQRPAFW